MNIIDYTSATIAATSGTILALADGGMPTTLPYRALSFKGKLETGQVRARGDGTAATSTEGEVVDIGDTIFLSQTEIGVVQFIRTGGTSGVIKGHFYDVPANELPGWTL